MLPGSLREAQASVNAVEVGLVQRAWPAARCYDWLIELIGERLAKAAWIAGSSPAMTKLGGLGMKLFVIPGLDPGIHADGLRTHWFAV